jgi:WD40-like Beta Propeller Repeat
MSTISAPPAGTIKMVAAGSTGAPRVAGNGGVVVWPEARNGHMAIMKYDHGTLSQVSEDGYDCTNAVVSDDGKVVVYSRMTPEHDGVDPNYDIIKNEDGVNTQLTTDPGNQFCTAISGDGKTIAWDDDIGTHFRFWQVDKWHDGQVTRLSDPKIDAEVPFIAGDTGQVFFVESKAGRSRISGEQPDGKVAPVVETNGFPSFCDVTGDGKTFTWTDNAGKMDRIERLDQGQVQPVIDEAGADNLWARINGDGSQMVWTRMDRKIEYSDSANVYDLATSQGTVVPTMPDIAKDGSTMAWMTVDLAKPGAVCQIFVYEKDPSQPAPGPSPAPPTSVPPAGR